MHTKVALLTGGGDRPYALGLASCLAAAGVAVDFIGSDELDDPELRRNPRIRFLNLRGDMRPDVPMVRKTLRVLAYYCRLVAYAVVSDAKIFHILWNNKFELFDRTVLMLFYRLLGKRIALTVHNVNIRKRDGKDGVVNRSSLGIQYRLVHHLFAHTEQMKHELQSDFGVPPDKISVIPFGINSTVPDTSLTGAEARQRLGFGAGDRVMLFFGNIAPYKGVEHLVEAMPQVVSSISGIRLVIAGRPKGHADYWAGIERRIEALELRGRILERIEYVPDADTELYFKASDVLVLPYTHVFQSGVLFLGYGFGIPVIVSDVASMKEDVVEGQTGFVCAPSDPSALAVAIERYFASDLYRDRDSKRQEIRRFANERHSWAKVASITVSAYAAMLGAG